MSKVLKIGIYSTLSVVVIAILLLGFNVFASPKATTTIDLYQTWATVNSERTKVGLKPLALSAELTASAQDKCNDMVAKDYWEHSTPDGKRFYVFVQKYIPDYDHTGENIAYGFTSSSEMVTGWMNSPTHKANILRNTYTDVGYAQCESLETSKQGRVTLVVQHFLDRR